MKCTGDERFVLDSRNRNCRKDVCRYKSVNLTSRRKKYVDLRPTQMKHSELEPTENKREIYKNITSSGILRRKKFSTFSFPPETFLEKSKSYYSSSLARLSE